MDEKKTYSYVGKVEIGTDEYRDLIEGLAKASADAEAQRSLKWAAEAKVSTLEKELAELTTKYNEYRDFIYSDAEIFKMFTCYQIKQMQSAQGDIEKDINN